MNVSRLFMLVAIICVLVTFAGPPSWPTIITAFLAGLCVASAFWFAIVVRQEQSVKRMGELVEEMAANVTVIEEQSKNDARGIGEPHRPTVR